MAKSEPVKVAVEIIDKFSDDLKELEAKLEKIDGKKLDVELDIDDGGDVEKVKGQLKALEKKLNSTLDLDMSGYLKAQAAKKNLSRDMYSTLHVKKNPMGHLGGGDSTGFDPPSLQNFSTGEKGAVNWIINDDVAGAMGKPPSHRGRVPGVFGAGQKYGRPDDYPDIDGFDTPFSPGRKYREMDFGFDMDFGLQDALDGLKGKNGSGNGDSVFGRVAKKLASMRPNIMMVWNFVALLIPLLVTMAGAALGAAAALGGIAVAGASIMGLGLLGYGESAAESMDMLGKKIQQVKKDVFQSLQPAMRSMNPLVDQFLDGLGPAMRKLAPALERMAGFEGFFGDVGSGLVDWAIRGLNQIANLREEISAIGRVLGAVFGDMIINVLSWATKELHDNMGAFMAIGSIFVSLISIIYNVSKAIAFAIAPFSGLLAIVARVARVLNNKYVLGLLTAVTAVLLLSGAIYLLHGAMTALSMSALKTSIALIATMAKEIVFLAASMVRTAATGIASMVTGLYSMAAAALSAIGVVGALNTALAATVALIAATGIGALLVLAGGAIGQAVIGDTRDSASDFTGGGSNYGGYDPGGMGGGGGATFNIYGDVGNSEYQKMKDGFGSMYAEESRINDETEK